MKKKEIKKTKLKPRKKAEAKKDQFTVVLEEMRYQFGVMSEGFSGVNKRFDKLDRKVDSNSNFKNTFEYLSKIDDEVQSIKEEMAEMRNNIINGEKIDPVKFFEIERRVEIVEKELKITAI